MSITGWTHIAIEADIFSPTPTVSWTVFSEGNSGATTTSATLTGNTASEYDTATIGARVNSSVVSEGMIGMMHSLYIIDSNYDSTRFASTGKI